MATLYGEDAPSSFKEAQESEHPIWKLDFTITSHGSFKLVDFPEDKSHVGF